MLKKNEINRNKKPNNLTYDEWEKVKRQADSWGRIWEHAYPGTRYDQETLIWDFSNNENAMKDWNIDKSDDAHFNMIGFACLYW